MFVLQQKFLEAVAPSPDLDSTQSNLPADQREIEGQEVFLGPLNQEPPSFPECHFNLAHSSRSLLMPLGSFSARKAAPLQPEQ